MMQRLTQEQNGRESKGDMIASKAESTFLLANNTIPVVSQVDINFTDIIRSAQQDMQTAMQEANKALQNCEAEVEVDGQVDIVCRADQIAISIKTRGRIARDKGLGW